MLREEDPYRHIYPDWQLALKHAKAIGPGRPSLSEDGSHQICKCCNSPVDHDEVDIMQSQKGLVYLGFGIPLYLQFIKFCISITLLLIVTDGMVSVYTAYTYNNQTCQKYYKSNSSTTTPFVKLRGSNSTLLPEIHDKMNNLCNNMIVKIATVQFRGASSIVLAQVASFIMHLIFQIYIKMALYQLGKYYDQISVDIDDYTVIVKRLPKQPTGKWQFFTNTANRIINLSHGRPLRINDSLIYDVVVVPWNKKLERDMEELQQKKSEALELKEQNPYKSQMALRQYDYLKLEIIKEAQHVRQQEKDDTLLSQTVFIIFFYEGDRMFFLREESQIIFRQALALAYGDQNAEKIIVEQAPRPRQILWKGLRNPLRRRFAASVLKSIGFLLAIFIAYYLLNIIKSHFILGAEADSPSTRNASPQEKSTNKFVGSLVAWLTFISIILFNKYVMGAVLFSFTQKEVHESRSDLSYSFAFTYAVGMFFTTSFMTIIIEGLMHGNYYDQSFGVIQQQSYMFLVASIVIPLMWAIHPGQLWHEYKRRKLQGSNSVSQKEANELMADQNYNIGQRYAQIVQMMWFSFLYTDLIPAGMFLMLFGMIAFYWVDKYNLLKRSSLQYRYSAALSDKAAYLIDWTLFWRFLGQVIFQYQLNGKVQYYSCTLLFIALLYIILPIPKIMRLSDQDNDFIPNIRPISMVWNEYFRNINYKSMNDMSRWIYTDKESRNVYSAVKVQGDMVKYHSNQLYHVLDTNYY